MTVVVICSEGGLIRSASVIDRVDVLQSVGVSNLSLNPPRFEDNLPVRRLAPSA